MGGTPTLDAFTVAFTAAVDRYRAMAGPGLAAAVVALCGDLDDDNVTVERALARVAADGSIDAAALVFVLTEDDPDKEAIAIEAMRSVAVRSADLFDEFLADGLTQLVEEELAELQRQGLAVRVGKTWHFPGAPEGGG